MKNFRYSGSEYTDSGLKNNDDSSLFMAYTNKKEFLLFLAVADGVGGLKNGDLASGFIIDQLKVWFEEEKKHLLELNLQEATLLIYDKVIEIHKALLVINEEKEITSGSTLTAALLFKKDFLVLHIGDSRAYLYDGKACRQITKDQTEGQLMRDQGIFREEEINHAMEKTIIQCVGQRRINPLIYTGPLPEIYQFLVCSDGLSNLFSELDFADQLGVETSGKTKLKTMAAIVRQRGEKDNITGVLASRIIDEKGDETGAESK